MNDSIIITGVLLFNLILPLTVKILTSNTDSLVESISTCHILYWSAKGLAMVPQAKPIGWFI